VDGPTWTEETFAASDGYRWRWRSYAAAGRPWADVVCLHGIQSHAGWYGHSCARLARAGCDVAFLDRRGSGRNPEARGDTPSWRRLADDVAEFLADRRRSRPGRPTVLLAVSWGGKLAVALQRRRPGLADALVLLCPGIRPRVGPSWRQRLAILWARLTRPSRLFPVPLSDPELFTATPPWQQFLRDDPLAVHRATARFLVESVRLDAYLRWCPRRVTVPTLLLLAGADRIIVNEATRAFVARFAGPTEVLEYPAAHHTLEFEPDPDRHTDDVLSWLRRTLPAPPSDNFGTLPRPTAS
jgi:alpha-beta hydrolase superfamily lysophospholipase